MNRVPAVKVAIDLVQVPSGVRRFRSEPLPEGVLTLLRIAAGEEADLADAAKAVGRPPELVRAASAFFVEQILLAPGTDSYKTLGAHQSSTTSELRRNMALLLRWLHPDKDPNGSRSLFASRVIAAWENLKTPERRAAYDSSKRERKARPRRMADANSWRASRSGVSIGRGSRPGVLQRMIERLLFGGQK
jgi:hypothetical protein